MKTSVKTMMMSLALMGCLIIGASDASAQSRSRSQGASTSSRSQSSTVSSTRPSSSTPQVSRPSTRTTDRTTSVPSSVSRPGNTRTTDRGISAPTGVSPSSSSSTGTATHDGPSSTIKGSTIGTQKVTQKGTPKRVTPRTDLTTKRVGTATAPREDGTSIKRDVKPGNGGKPDRGGRPDSGGKPADRGSKPGGHGGHGGYDPNNRYDYNQHPYRDEFRMNHERHIWDRPLPPPHRPHRPAPWVVFRPTIPAGWHPYVGAPTIDRILGLLFGTLYNVSLDYLYSNGYFIDGYADGVIFLRDVPMLNLYWPDAMLNYDNNNRLVNAQFVYYSSYYDMSRYNRVYRSLSRIYGAPVFRDGTTISWYGGNNTGFVTLSMYNDYGNYYTTMSIGY